MESLDYEVLFYVTCAEEPALKLVGVCKYDIYVTEQRIEGLHREIMKAINSTAHQYYITPMCKGEERTLDVVITFEPMDPDEMAIRPDPSASTLARLPKSVNTCINVSMKAVHALLYPLSKPMG